MRETIDFGIDLGTTNSAIAVFENDAVSVIKNNDGSDITPSAIFLPKPDTVFVGRKALDHVWKNRDNAICEFKQSMGLAGAQRRFVKAGRELSPEQMSAEVLKSLRADATHYHGTPPDCAVITVPAAFALNQNNATRQAAALAGLGSACPLLQEPTAAAFAYGLSSSVERAYWMVFDFGGGTFDAAVVSMQDGDLRVINHAGDPYLGGKLIDWAVAEQILAPAASTQLNLPDFRRSNPDWWYNFGELKQAAEHAKIELSRREQAEIDVELIDHGGQNETFSYTLTRGELDRVAEPFYSRAINLCRTALSESALGPDAIDLLLLVGGTTLAPGLRERLSDPRHGLGIELETRLDPTTVVARGAAVFASTLCRPRGPVAAPATGEFNLNLSYEPSVTEPTATIAGNFAGATSLDWTGYSVVLSNPAGRPPFRSARISLNAKGAFLTDVEIEQHHTSTFTVELFDANGARRKVTPEQLSITHRKLGPGALPLTSSLGIQLVGHEFAPIVAKGAELPATGRAVFHTSGTLSRNDPETMVRIPVVQGERERADRNRPMGVLEIRPRDIPRDLQSGSEVEITFEVDTSGLVTVFADVPVIDAQFEATINLNDITAPDPSVLRAKLASVEDRFESVREVAEQTGASDAKRLVEQFEQERAIDTAADQVQAASTEPAAGAAAEDRIRELHARLDVIESAAELPALEQQLRQLVSSAQDVVRRTANPSDADELATLERRAEEAIAARNANAMRAQIDRALSLLIDLERRDPNWPIKLFYLLLDVLPPSAQTAALSEEGKTAIGQRDSATLDAVNQRLLRLLPEKQKDMVIDLVRRQR
jgi:molecular chaperone DnaK